MEAEMKDGKMTSRIKLNRSERVGDIEYNYNVEYEYDSKTPCFTTLEYLPDILVKIMIGKEEC